jgi:hypothetical protein
MSWLYMRLGLVSSNIASIVSGDFGRLLLEDRFRMLLQNDQTIELEG